MAKFNIQEAKARVRANPPKRTGKDELTEEMHDTFSLSEEDEKRASVFAYLEMLLSDPSAAGPEEMAEYGITTDDIRKYRPDFLSE
jgi:hypothetical protein